MDFIEVTRNKELLAWFWHSDNTFSASMIWKMRKELLKNNNDEEKSEVFGNFHPLDPREL